MASTTVIISFLVFLALFVLIGGLSKLYSQPTAKDYLLASQNIPPSLVALSAVASNNSGYMFIGMIGYTYQVGLASIWLAIGWITGDFIASLFIHRQVRITTEKNNVHNFGGLLSGWYQPNFQRLKNIVGIVTIVFLGSYAAAQLNAGSKALHVLFGWPYEVGAIIGAVIVVIYCYAGGIRASIWTDVAQSIVMIIAMLVLTSVAFLQVGGWDAFSTQIQAVSSSYLNIFPDNSYLGPLLGPLVFILSWLFAGFVVIGQPHIMSRFMAMDKPSDMKRARVYYYAWYIFFFAFTILVGLFARLLIKQVDFDAELALPMLAIQLLNPVFVGLVMAGLFAATMSTADSQILSCSAAVSEDFSTKQKPYWVYKLSTLLITVFALCIAIFGSKNVFSLVVFSWAALGAAFAPIITLYVLGKKLSQPIAITMILAAIATVICWDRLFGFMDVYSVLPATIISFLIYFLSCPISSLINRASNAKPLQQ
tara:strand:- start:2974 stop:4416 length:1443 start_codon:yes stop_codon:yes gene_type:complete